MRRKTPRAARLLLGRVSRDSTQLIPRPRRTKVRRGFCVPRPAPCDKLRGRHCLHFVRDDVMPANPVDITMMRGVIVRDAVQCSRGALPNYNLTAGRCDPPAHAPALASFSGSRSRISTVRVVFPFSDFFAFWFIAIPPVDVGLQVDPSKIPEFRLIGQI